MWLVSCQLVLYIKTDDMKDYSDMQSRDPDDRVYSITVGVGCSMLSNSIIDFLNIKGTR